MWLKSLSLPPQTRFPSPVWYPLGWSSLPVISQLVDLLGLNSSTTSNLLSDSPPATSSPFPKIINYYKFGPEQNFYKIMILRIWGYYNPKPFTNKRIFFLTFKRKITFSYILKGIHIHVSRRQPSWQNLCSTHKYKIPNYWLSQIDGLEAGSITYEDPSLLVDRKFVNLAHKISW